MMTDTMTGLAPCEIAEHVASEAIEALMTVYWADSFNIELLQTRLMETIALHTRDALTLREAPPPNRDTGSEAAIALCRSDSEQDDSSEEPHSSPSQPTLDLSHRPSPGILSVVALGYPDVVNNFVMTLFQYGYARPDEWSWQIPTGNAGEVMRVMTKRVNPS